MLSRTLRLWLIALIALSLTGCELIEGAFKLGVWLAVIAIAVLVIAGVAGYRFFRRVERHVRE